MFSSTPGRAAKPQSTISQPTIIIQVGVLPLLECTSVNAHHAAIGMKIQHSPQVLLTLNAWIVNWIMPVSIVAAPTDIKITSMSF